MMKLQNIFKLSKIQLRVMYWFVVVFFMFFVISPMFFFFYSFNENQVKQILFEQFDNNNYHVTAGKIIPKFWHGLSFEVEDVQFTTKSDVELLHIKNLSCQLSWLDLSIGQYKIKRVALNDVKVNEKNIMSYGLDNLLNWSKIDHSVFNNLNTLMIFGINSINDVDFYPIHDGVLQLQKKGQVAKFKFGFKNQYKDTFTVFSGNMVQTSNDIIHLDDFLVRAHNDKMNLQLTADTSYSIPNKQLLLSNLKGNIHLSKYSGVITVADLAISTIGIDAKNFKLALAFNNIFANQNLSLVFDKVSMPKFKQTLIDNVQLKYDANFQKNKLNIDSKLANVKISSTQITSFNCVNNFDLTSPSLVNDGIKVQLSGGCKYNFDQKFTSLNLAGYLNKAPVVLNLKVYNGIQRPRILVSGAMDNLDLSSLDVNHDDKHLPFYADNRQLPFGWLSLLDINGNLAIKNFALDRITLKNVTTKFVLKDDTLNVTDLKANVYGGILQGNGRISKHQNSYSIKATDSISNLDIQKMFGDLFNVGAISGMANLRFDISIDNVLTYNDLHRNFNGIVILDANHGVFHGVDFNIFATPKVDLTNNKSTVFQQLKAQYHFVNGVSRNQEITFYSPYVIANGMGNVDFINSSLDYKLTIKSALPQNDQRIKSVVIPVSVNGNLFNPKITIQNIQLSKVQAISIARNTSLPKKKHDKHKLSKARYTL